MRYRTKTVAELKRDGLYNLLFERVWYLPNKEFFITRKYGDHVEGSYPPNSPFSNVWTMRYEWITEIEEPLFKLEKSE